MKKKLRKGKKAFKNMNIRSCRHLSTATQRTRKENTSTYSGGTTSVTSLGLLIDFKVGLS